MLLKNKPKRKSFKLGRPKKKRRKKTAYKPSLMAILKIPAIVLVAAAACVGLVLLDKYVGKNTASSAKTPIIELADPPEWINEQLKNKIKDKKSPEELHKRLHTIHIDCLS